MSCNYNSISVHDRFKGPGKNFKLDCSGQIRAMNDVLQLLWLDIYDFKSNEDIVEFSGNGIKQLATTYPVYAVKAWYFNKACGSNLSKDYSIDRCKACGDCEDNYEAYILYDIGTYKTLAPCQFSFCRDTKIIDVNIPSVVDGGYVKYYKGPELITSISDKLPIQPSLYPAIKYLMKVLYYEESGSLFQGDDLKAETRYNTIIQKIKDKDFSKLKLVI